MSTSALEDRRIRALRPPKPDDRSAPPPVVELERRPDGRVEQTLTAFLTGAECPFTCAFCDLWQWTLDGATPRGSLVRQLSQAIGSFCDVSPQRLKIYNASNFFDRRAVPVIDLPRIAELCEGFTGVTVESHASTVGPATLEFARMLEGRLEVAMGLETIHAVGAANLNKKLDLARFDRAAEYLLAHDMDLRVFVLLGAPYVPAEESVEWTLRTVEYAASRGASLVSIIPVRGGNGEMERLEALGHFSPPTLSQLEEALERSQQIPTAASRLRDDTRSRLRDDTYAVVTADLWDVHKLATCDRCRVERMERLHAINISGHVVPRGHCGSCGQ